MGTYLTIMVVCLILSSFFSATETAFSAMNTTKLKTLAEKGNKNAALVCKLDEQYDKLISTVLIGNNIVNIAMASVGTVLFTLKFGDMGATMSTIVVTIVVLIFGEISPKSIANNCPEQLAMFAAPVVQFLIWLFLPLNVLFSGWQKLLTKIFHLEPSSKMSQEELLTLVNEVQEDGTIDEDEGGLLRNAIEFSDQEARDILIHRTDLAALPITATKEEIAQMFTETKFSRLLIYQDSIDDILGTIHRKDFYVGCGITEKEVKDIISPAIFVLESEPIRMILKKQQKAKTHVAVVVDEYGGTCGIVTMEDILEELVGEIWDEHEEAEVLLRRIAPDTYLIDASMDFEEFAEYFHLDEESEMVSVSGWVMEQFGRVPDQGDHLEYKGLEIEVTRVGNHHVDEIRVKQNNVEAEEASEEE
ncbi:HlyC/CorC family transporter [Anaerosacchariphilus sp. NSJ-68]|uniref:HlyC/CorC family transporter n=2 Tax=Lachnospiraceae TaxID=186803 RepID=A0A923RN73_9FIRM|nr:MULTISPECIES: hemolysin family protein [Lachnospiraceae]MBC5659095.1 HlyC/CorC family transporter [Anaerosacchariphilus hominis]MBC5698635.1 HlyC/CorC family transporter [Roseburia difficilis]